MPRGNSVSKLFGTANRGVKCTTVNMSTTEVTLLTESFLSSSQLLYRKSTVWCYNTTTSTNQLSVRCNKFGYLTAFR